VVVDVSQVLAQVVDRDSRHVAGVELSVVVPSGPGRFVVRDPLAQDRDEVAEHVDDGAPHTEEIGVEVLLGHAIANLALEARVELVFRDGVQHRPVVVGAGRFGVPGAG